MSVNVSASDSSDQRRLAPLLVGYVLLVITAVGLFLVVRSWGEAFYAPQHAIAATATAPVKSAAGSLPHLLGGLIGIAALARLLGRLLHRFGQPRVIGEIIAGIVIGPSILGRVVPDAVSFLFPTTTLPLLSAIAQLGIILYMFLVGLHLDTSILRSRAHATVVISHASIVVPFLLGTTLALWLFREYAPAGVPFTAFALFLGLAMAITAFPVLARILTDRGIDKTALGTVALSCAAADDVTAWCLLALVIGVTQASIGGAVLTLLLSAAYLAAMLLIVRPLLLAWIARQGSERPKPDATAAALIGVLASALLTDVIGIHALFGAFLLGAIIPHDSPLATSFRGKLEDLVTVLLLPTFFAYTGLRTQIGLLSNPGDWLVCGVILLVATAGKFGGSLLAARLTGLDWRTSSALGVLMNTRGLMELIVLNVGLDLGILSPELFAMMVLMAIATTVATSPILNLLGAGTSPRRSMYSAAV